MRYAPTPSGTCEPVDQAGTATSLDGVDMNVVTFLTDPVARQFTGVVGLKGQPLRMAKA